MGEATDLKQMALEKLIGEAKQKSAKLSNGSGTVESCPAHSDMAGAIKLCLDILVYQLVHVANPRKQFALTGGAIGVALFLDAVIRLLIAMHGGDADSVPSMTGAITSVSGGN